MRFFLLNKIVLQYGPMVHRLAAKLLLSGCCQLTYHADLPFYFLIYDKLVTCVDRSYCKNTCLSRYHWFYTV